MDPHINFALALAPEDGHRALVEDAEIAEALRHPDPAWLHLKADHPDTPDWVSDHLGWLDAETRPRAARIDEGLLVILRGINLNPGAEPEDMVAVRFWIDPARIVSLSRRRLRSLEAVARQIEGGQGPAHAGALLAAVTEEITERIETHLVDLDDRTEALEDIAICGPDAKLREDITDLRREITELRRYIAPQRDALLNIMRSDVEWLTQQDRRELHESHDRTVRAVEELDDMRDRLQLVRDELTNAMSERLNENLYLLSIISAVFLPLGFLTGLMGINLGGMPGANSPYAFWIFTGGLVVLVIALMAFLRWRRWF